MSRRRDTRPPGSGASMMLRVVLYFALALSAFVTMAGLPAIQRRVEAGQWHALWLIAPAVCFGLFLVIYIADRVWLLRHRNYPSGRALFQVVFGVVFVLLLLPSSIREYRSVLQRRPPRQSLYALMLHSDARVRSAACELSAHRPEAERYLDALSQRLVDPSSEVREAAQVALEQITGHLFATSAEGQVELVRFLEDRGAVAAMTATGRKVLDGSIEDDAAPASNAGEDSGR
ncbi:MAG: hypothetical protein ABIJ09_27225 [Pseudomonadota bacterium]